MEKFKIKCTYECEAKNLKAVVIKEVGKIPENLPWKSIKVSKEIIDEVIEYYNEKLDKNIRKNTASYIRIITARINEGYTVEDLKKVIDIKVADWAENKEMAKNLKLSTLFRPSHFDEYLNQVTAVDKKKLQSKPSYDLEKVMRDAMNNTEIC